MLKRIKPPIDNWSGLVRPFDQFKTSTLSRLRAYVDWLDRRGHRWDHPDLDAYRDYLLHQRGLEPATVQTQVATIRGRYQLIVQEREKLGRTVSVLIREAADPNTARVDIQPWQSRPEKAGRRLTAQQIYDLLAQPGINTLVGKRDTAVLALMVGMGLREGEVCALDVADMFQVVDEAPALHVPQGVGCKERLIPYGVSLWTRRLTEDWLHAAQLEAGAVFWSFFRGNQRRRTRLTGRAVQDILHKYPVIADGQAVHVTPRDLRRTYAYQRYLAWGEIPAIQQALGLTNRVNATRLIGEVDWAVIQSKDVFDGNKLLTVLYKDREAPDT